jgi:hypothetical protein
MSVGHHILLPHQGETEEDVVPDTHVPCVILRGHSLQPCDHATTRHVLGPAAPDATGTADACNLRVWHHPQRPQMQQYGNRGNRRMKQHMQRVCSAPHPPHSVRQPQAPQSAGIRSCSMYRLAYTCTRLCLGSESCRNFDAAYPAVIATYCNNRCTADVHRHTPALCCKSTRTQVL